MRLDRAARERIKRHAKIRYVDGIRWITYPDEINGTKVIVDMPVNALTKSCDQGRHDSCPHRLGGPQEGGVISKCLCRASLAVRLPLPPRPVPRRPPVLTTPHARARPTPALQEDWPDPLFFRWWRRRAPRDRRTSHLSGGRNPQPLILFSRQQGAHGKRAGARPVNPRPHRGIAVPSDCFRPSCQLAQDASRRRARAENPANTRRGLYRGCAPTLTRLPHTQR